MGRQLAARLIPPEHDGRIGSFAMGDQHACHGTCIIVQITVRSPSQLLEDILTMSSIDPVLCSTLCASYHCT